MPGPTSWRTRSTRPCTRPAPTTDVRVIVLTGAGRAFCAGGDITGFKSDNPRQLIDKLPRPLRLQPPPGLTRAARPIFRRSRNRSSAMLNGATAGLGLVHALFCDVRFAAEDATLTTAFARHRARVGVRDGAGSCNASAGHANALDLLLSARKVKGPEALRTRAREPGVSARRSWPRRPMPTRARSPSFVSPRSTRVIKQQLWDLPFQTLHEAVITRQRRDDASQRLRGLPGGQACLHGEAPAEIHRSLRTPDMDFRESPEDIAFRAEVRDIRRARSCRTTSATVCSASGACRARTTCAWQRILQREGLGRAGLAEAVRRHRLERDASGTIFEEECFEARRAAPDSVRPVDGRAGADEVRHAGEQQATISAAHPVDGRLVVPGLLGAGRRFGPRLAEDAGRAARRRLRGQRTEDVDHASRTTRTCSSAWCGPAPKASRSRVSRSC